MYVPYPVPQPYPIYPRPWVSPWVGPYYSGMTTTTVTPNFSTSYMPTLTSGYSQVIS